MQSSFSLIGGCSSKRNSTVGIHEIWAYEVFPALAALDLVVHKDNAYIPRMLHWRSNSSPCFYELMSQVFENREVDVQLLRPSVIGKQQLYWTWGDSVDDTEELVELFGDYAEKKTSTSASVEEKDEDIDETASLPSSSKGKLASTELRTLKHDFQRTKDDLAKVASSNRALRNRVRGEGHEDHCSPHMNKGGDNDLSPLHDYVSPPTESVAMETQVPDDGVEPSAAMVVEEAEMAASVPHLQVHEAAEQAQSEKLPTAEDVAGCDEICQRLLFLLEDWKITESMPSGGPMNPPSMPKVSMAGDEEGSLSVEKKRVEGKGCRQKRPTQTLLSPFTDPLGKKRTMSVSDATATPPCFDPSKPLPIEDVKAVLEFCTDCKNDIRLGFLTFEIQSSSYSTPGHGNLSHPEKATLSSIGIWNSLDNVSLLLAEPFKATAKKRGSKKAAASNTIDPPPSKLNNIHHYVRAGYTSAPISDTLARVMYNMHFYEDSEVEEVKQKGLQMSRFTPFSVCSIADVPQQRDGPHSTACRIMTVKFIEHLSAGISLDKVDPPKSKYYRLKLAIEGYTSTILLKNGKLSDFISELQITVLKGNDSQIGLTSLIMPAATLGALGYGYMWWKNTKKHLTKRVQNLDDKLLEQKEISKSILENVGDTKGSIEELYVTVTELQSALTGLVSSASTCIGVGQICNLSYFSLLQDYKLGSISEKQDVSNLGVFYLVNFVEGKQVEMPQQVCTCQCMDLNVLLTLQLS
ncbi:hypothetical protein L3X38_008775 [Prunus dulcis]|uniref:Uncharacterized protein n=1 Tax=Prunus dulcis TaxID=3755 RepID=A0AAD5F7G3_PRUDU|nr:hypothetical protein L3X38_008775 [Prunus dulcis]